MSILQSLGQPFWKKSFRRLVLYLEQSKSHLLSSMVIIIDITSLLRQQWQQCWCVFKSNLYYYHVCSGLVLFNRKSGYVHGNCFFLRVDLIFRTISLLYSWGIHFMPRPLMTASVKILTDSWNRQKIKITFRYCLNAANIFMLTRFKQYA